MGTLHWSAVMSVSSSVWLCILWPCAAGLRFISLWGCCLVLVRSNIYEERFYWCGKKYRIYLMKVISSFQPCIFRSQKKQQLSLSSVISPSLCISVFSPLVEKYRLDHSFTFLLNTPQYKYPSIDLVILLVIGSKPGYSLLLLLLVLFWTL